MLRCRCEDALRGKERSADVKCEEVKRCRCEDDQRCRCAAVRMSKR